MNLEDVTHAEDLCKLHPNNILALRKEGRYTILPLAEELLAFGS